MKYVLCLLSIILLSAATVTAQGWSPGGPISDEEYKFISEIRGASPKADLVIAERTLPLKIVPPDDPNIFVNSYTSVKKLKKRFPKLSDETVLDFNAKNDRSHKWENNFSFSGKYTFASDEQIRSTLSGPGEPYDQRRAFRNAFPRAAGYCQFSRPGFNAARDQALIYEVYECGEDCGSSTYHFYIKRKGVWKLKGKFVKFLS
jgi:hypothetical protein